ncbi:MAG: hypothetical protein FD137_2418 [Spirochaetes bacterium]|nr:MAG: hypothetical protein FD137_2418 [Spirochaetota bacterium]
MKSRMQTALVLILASTILLVAACDNSFGVFSEIQTEIRQVGTDQFKNAAVRSLDEDGSNYYAVMAKVFKKAKTNGTWAVLPIGTGTPTTSYFSLGFAVDSSSGTLYAASGNLADSSLIKVFSSTDSGATWTALGSSALLAGSGGSRVVTGLFFANTTLFALVQNKSTLKYDLLSYDSQGTQDFAAIAGLAGMDLPLLALAHNGTRFWAATRSSLFTSPTGATFTADTFPGTPSGNETIRGLVRLSDGDIAVTTGDGQIYVFDAGTSAWAAAVEVNDGVELGPVLEVPVDPTDGASAKRLILGKKDAGYGYYEWNPADSSRLLGNAAGAIFSQPSSNYTTTVYGKPVLSMHFSDSQDTVLIGLAAQGTDSYALYSNTFASGSWSGWTAE